MTHHRPNTPAVVGLVVEALVAAALRKGEAWLARFETLSPDAQVRALRELDAVASKHAWVAGPVAWGASKLGRGVRSNEKVLRTTAALLRQALAAKRSTSVPQSNPRSKRRRNPHLPPTTIRGLEVQALLFPVFGWSPMEARAWALNNGYRALQIDQTDEHFRIRQGEPSAYKRASFRIVPLKDGVQATLAAPTPKTLEQRKAFRRGRGSR